MVDDEVRWLGNKAADLLAEYDVDSAAPGLPSFESVERFWDDEVKPRLGEFKTMSQSWTPDPELSRDSVWHANWRIPDRS